MTSVRVNIEDRRYNKVETFEGTSKLVKDGLWVVESGVLST